VTEEWPPCSCAVCVAVNGEPRLSRESSDVRQLRNELLLMRDKVERLINRLELASFSTATAATVANDDNGQLTA